MRIQAGDQLFGRGEKGELLSFLKRVESACSGEVPYFLYGLC